MHYIEILFLFFLSQKIFFVLSFCILNFDCSFCLIARYLSLFLFFLKILIIVRKLTWISLQAVLWFNAALCTAWKKVNLINYFQTNNISNGIKSPDIGNCTCKTNICQMRLISNKQWQQIYLTYYSFTSICSRISKDIFSTRVCDTETEISSLFISYRYTAD